jgi:heat shock protein HslJ
MNPNRSIIGAFAIILFCCAMLFPRHSAAEDVPVQDLAGTSWFADENAGATVGDDPRWTISFDANGQVEGRAGCNRFFGSFTIKGNTISFGTLKANQMLCKPSLMEEELQYLENLRTATSFHAQNQTLLLFGDATAPILRFSEINPSSEPPPAHPATQEAKPTTWYLMMPSASEVPEEQQVRPADASATPSPWTAEKSFDSRSACEALMAAEQMVAKTSASPAYVAQHAQAKCLSADDAAVKATLSDADEPDPASSE